MPADGSPDFADPGLLDAAQIALLIDQYELAMAASYLRQDMDRPAVFEHFVRKLPPRRRWLLAAGLAPTLELIAALRFGEAELAALRRLGFDEALLGYLAEFRFSGDIDALPEGTVFTAGEPIIRVTAPLIEAQLLETLVLNQVNFQTMVATKAARVVLAAGAGEAGGGGRVVDFSPRRDHGIDAAMKVARAAAIAGVAATSNLAAAARYGLPAVGTMAHSYVLAFASERQAFEAFMHDNPDNAILLVDTYDTRAGVANAIAASQATGVPIRGIRIDSGDLLALAREARWMLNEAGHPEASITASGDLDEHRISDLVAAAAPIDIWGVGTELGTSRDSPVVNGVFKLVALATGDGAWRGVGKRSPQKETRAGAKQVYRRIEQGQIAGDTIAADGADLEGEPLLVPVMRNGEIVHRETLDEVRARARAQINSLPAELRGLEPGATSISVSFAGG